MPKRIQRRRTKGWRMPRGAIYVGRPTLFGNPFTLAGLYRLWLAGELDRPKDEARRQRIIDHLPELRGKDLVCWCSLDRECHADSLLELANK